MNSGEIVVLLMGKIASESCVFMAGMNFARVQRIITDWLEPWKFGIAQWLRGESRVAGVSGSSPLSLILSPPRPFLPLSVYFSAVFYLFP
jgi:hypothetical protein